MNAAEAKVASQKVISGERWRLVSDAELEWLRDVMENFSIPGSCGIQIMLLQQDDGLWIRDHGFN